MLEDIRTVFWVISQDASVNGSGWYLLTRSTSGAPDPDWHNNNNGKLYGSYTNAKIKMALPEWMVPLLMVPLQIIQITFQLSRSEQQETVLQIVSDMTEGTR